MYFSILIFLKLDLIILCFSDGIFLDFWCTQWLIYMYSMELFWYKRKCSFCKPRLKIKLMLYVECVTFALCSLTLVECWCVSHDVEQGLYTKKTYQCVKWGWQASRLLRFVAFVHLPFSFQFPDLFCRFSVVYDGHFVLCCKEKL